MDPKVKIRNIKQVNYEEIEKTAEEFRNKSKEIEAKIYAMSEARQAIKNNHTLKLHGKTWQEEILWLKNEEKNLCLFAKDPQYDWILQTGEINADFIKYKLAEEKFSDIVIKPIMTMRNDLKEWLQNKLAGRTVPEPQPIKEIIANMHSSVEKIEQKLCVDERKCSEECSADYHLIESNQNPFTYFNKEMGIPESAWNWESPDQDFLCTLLSEFVVLDADFFNRLAEVRREYESLHWIDTTEWTAEELEKFDYSYEIFKRHVTSQRRQLTIDFISRLLGDRTVADLNTLADRREREHHLKERALTITRMWKKAREDLSIRIRATLLQAMEIIHQKHMEAELYQTQRELCELLKEQVRRWRKEKTELAELEEKENAKIKLKEEEIKATQKAKEKATRQAIKAKIAAHQAIKTDIQEKNAQNEAARLKFLRDMHTKQTRIDIARLTEAEKYRLNQIKQKLTNTKLESDRLVLEKESRLENLRQKVRPNVPSDPLRAKSETESWKIKVSELRREMENESDSIITVNTTRIDNKLYTFTNAQLCADERTRITNALHSAGLLDSDYARTLLANYSFEHHPRDRKDNITSDQVLAAFGQDKSIN